MKKPLTKLLLLLLFTNTLFAFNENYKEALTYFNNKNYLSAYMAFKDIEKKQVSTLESKDLEKLNFYLGRTSFELQKYEQAYSYFERVLIVNNNHHRTRLEFARTMLALKMYEEAKLEFLKVRNSNIPLNIRNNIDLFLTQIENNNKKSSFSKILMLGIGVDTNVNSVYDGDVFYAPLNLILPAQDEKKDHYFEQLFLVNHKYSLDKQKAYAWDTTAFLYAQQYNRIHDSNVEFLSLTTGPTYASQKYSLALPITYERLRYGSQSYLYNYGIGFKYNRIFENNIVFSNNYSYKKKKNLIQANKSSDSNAKAVSFSLAKVINSKNSIVSTINFEKQNKDSSLVNTNVKKKKYSLNLAYNHVFNDKYSTNLSFKHEKNDYAQIDTANGFNSKREDMTNTVSINTTYSISKNKSLSLKYSNINHNSNQNQYIYDKDVFALSYMYQF